MSSGLSLSAHQLRELLAYWQSSEKGMTVNRKTTRKNSVCCLFDQTKPRNNNEFCCHHPSTRGCLLAWARITHVRYPKWKPCGYEEPLGVILEASSCSIHVEILLEASFFLLGHIFLAMLFTELRVFVLGLRLSVINLQNCNIWDIIICMGWASIGHPHCKLLAHVNHLLQFWPVAAFWTVLIFLHRMYCKYAIAWIDESFS